MRAPRVTLLQVFAGSGAALALLLGALLLLFFAAFLLVYLVGFFNLDTKQSLDQFVKGMVKFVLHFGLLVCGVAYLVRRCHDTVVDSAAHQDAPFALVVDTLRTQWTGEINPLFQLSLFVAPL